MKRILLFLFLLFTFALTGLAQADMNYPYTTPTYRPSPVSPAVTYSAPAVYKLTLNDVNTVVVTIAGTCTSFSATPKAGVDGTNYVQINEYPVSNAASGVAAVSNAAITSAGTYRFNASGMKYFELDITALTASCTVSASGSSAAFTNIE